MEKQTESKSRFRPSASRTAALASLEVAASAEDETDQPAVEDGFIPPSGSKDNEGGETK